MYSPYKKLTAQLLLFSFLLESCYNPHIGVSKKMPLTPKGATHQQHQYKENTYSKNLEPPTSLACTMADGHAITFTYHNQAWQAEICMPNGRRQLPVTFEPGYTIEDLINKGPTEQQQLIHLCTNRDNKDPINHIYIGKTENNKQYINKIATKEHSQPAEASAQEQTSLQTIPSPVQAIPASPNSQSQPQASSKPLPIPNSELFGYNNDQNKYNNAHKTSNKTTPSLKSQTTLAHSQRVAQTKRQERVARTKPTDEPAPTAHLKQTTPLTTPQTPSPAARTSQDITSPIFVAQGGQRVHFIYKNDQWQASVREQIGAFSRTEVLPVFCERHGDIAAALLGLQGKPDKYVQQRIHVMRTRQVPYVPKFVYLGEQGLKGGGDPEPSGSGEPPTRGYAAATDSRARPSLAATGHSTSWWALQERMAQVDITSTEDLVKALNEAQTPEERQALQEWVHAYIEWFNDQSVGNLTQRQGAAVHEYSLLAGIRADNAEQQQLLRDYCNSICNKIDQEYQHGEEPLIQALEQTLQTLDSCVFEGNLHSLIQLGNKLLAKLNPSDHFSKETYPTHRSLLYALHQTLVLIKQIDPNWDSTKEDGLYSRFKGQLQDIARSAKYYYPVRYHALLLEQVLQLLARPQGCLQKIRGRVWHGLKGMIYLYQGTPIPGVSLRPNLNDLQKGYKSLQEAFRVRGISWCEWLLELTDKCVPC